MKCKFLFLFLLLCLGCSDDNNLKQALNIAGDNRQELEKVLKYYKGDPDKQKAARFLIENMPGHVGVDISVIEKMQPIYDKHVEISEKHNWTRTKDWYNEIDDLWSNERRNKTNNINSKQDITTVKAEWLINEIDRSFKAWKENVYTRNAPFEDFYRYILPYRFSEGICLDDSRDVFYQRHALFFNDPDKDLIEATDSLLKTYSFLTHNDWAAASMPIYNAATFEQIKRGSCDDRTWFNCLLMSSLGMAPATDFVPIWGNRNGGHSWNSLIIDGETYPFEPFWDDDRWKYKQIYNNECIDQIWGKFRLPKVYRHSYEHNINELISDKHVDRNDIPILFRNPFIMDVSAQYFQPADVEVAVTEEIPESTQYCYLCVYSRTEWHPVQYGKIDRNGKVIFKDMGKDIIYLPMFYKQGNLTPAAPAFLLDQNGVCETLKCDDEKISVTVRNYTSYLDPGDILESKKTLIGSYLLGYDGLPGNEADTLLIMTDNMDAWSNHITLSKPGKYRYIQLVPAHDTIDICDIAFFDQGVNNPITGVKVSADIIPLLNNEELGMIADNLSATGFRGQFKSEKERKRGIWFDLGEVHPISRISYIPYTYNYLLKDTEQELLYWDNGWISGGSLKCEGSSITFENIPKGTVYRVKLPKYITDRIFTYEDGIINWY